MKWTLSKMTEDGAYNKHRKANEPVYHYRSEKGDEVAFHSNHKKAFSYVLVKGDRKQAADLINVFVEQGLKQHEYVGGFEQAIAVLEI